MENMQKYSKPALTINEQIALLKNRGLIVNNEEELSYYLKNINYYHLTIYFKHYQRDDNFREGVSFDDVLKIYKFDNKLRFLLLELLERIEKSFKCRMVYELAIEQKDPHWYLNKEFFVDNEGYLEILRLLQDEVEKSKEISINHYKNKYNDPILPPIWAVVEILSFGQCVRICKYLKREYKNKISRSFGEDEMFLMSWMHSLSVLRNICAHYSCLWNRNLVFTPKNEHHVYGKFFRSKDRRLYNHIVVLQILLSKMNPTASWLDKFKELVAEFEIDVTCIGFPDDWESRLNKIMLIK